MCVCVFVRCVYEHVCIDSPRPKHKLNCKHLKWFLGFVCGSGSGITCDIKGCRAPRKWVLIQ